MDDKIIIKLLKKEYILSYFKNKKSNFSEKKVILYLK
jgi:hypothetical protein